MIVLGLLVLFVLYGIGSSARRTARETRQLVRMQQRDGLYLRAVAFRRTPQEQYAVELRSKLRWYLIQMLCGAAAVLAFFVLTKP